MSPLPSITYTFIISHQSYFCPWRVSRRITYCTENGVLNLCKGKQCVVEKKLFIAWHLPEGLVFARVLRMAALYLSHGRASLLPTAHCQCQEHLCKVVMQTCHLWEARSGRTECVSSVICVLKGVSFQPARRRQDEKRKVLGILESSHITAKQRHFVELWGL